MVIRSIFKCIHQKAIYQMTFTLSKNQWQRSILTHWGRDKNGRYFAEDTFKFIFLNENVRISIEISLKFVPKGPINNIPALFQIMAWRRLGAKPLCEPIMVRLLMHICVTWPQWVNIFTTIFLTRPTTVSSIHTGQLAGNKQSSK